MEENLLQALDQYQIKIFDKGLKFLLKSQQKSPSR